VVEGVMGLFDGKSGGGEYASTAHIAKLLRAPVLLVVDAGAMARSAAAIVHGYATFDPELRVAGVILNRVGSPTHEKMLREAIEPLNIPILGVLRRDANLNTPDRHLGLVPAAERREEARKALDRTGEEIPRSCDLDGSCVSPPPPNRYKQNLGPSSPRERDDRNGVRAGSGRERSRLQLRLQGEPGALEGSWS
jgi:cobyrinic acid a,c-diamide synthase